MDWSGIWESFGVAYWDCQRLGFFAMLVVSGDVKHTTVGDSKCSPSAPPSSISGSTSFPTLDVLSTSPFVIGFAPFFFFLFLVFFGAVSSC